MEQVKNSANGSYIAKFLKAIESGHNSYDSLTRHSEEIGISIGSIGNTATLAKKMNYITLDKKEKHYVYTLTETGKKRINYYGKRMKTNHTTPNVKLGTYTHALLHICSSFNSPISKRMIQSKYTYNNFNNTLYIVVHKGYIIESNGEYTLTEKGKQRLHILDMQLNEASECVTSSNKCMNARVVEVKKQVIPTNETLPIITPKIASAPSNVTEDIPETALTIEPVHNPQRSFLSRIVSSIFG